MKLMKVNDKDSLEISTKQDREKDKTVYMGKKRSIRRRIVSKKNNTEQS